MEVGIVSSLERTMLVCYTMEAMVVETVVAAGKYFACLLFLTGSLLNDIDALAKLTAMDERFPFDELRKMKHPDAENKDASDTEDDGEDDDNDNADDQDDDDAGDEDYSGEEGEEDADPEDDPDANGDGGSDEEDDDDEDNGDEDAEEDGEDEEEEEDEDEDDGQPPSKKRK